MSYAAKISDRATLAIIDYLAQFEGSAEIPEDEILPEYDLTGGQRGKYAARYAKGNNLVLLEPDVAEVFPNAGAVNRALRALAEIIKDRQNDAP